MLGPGTTGALGGFARALSFREREGAVGSGATRCESRALVDRWSLGGIGPATALFLARLVTERRPRAILECGPGASTIAMARTLDRLGSAARIVTLEHDQRWAARMRRRLSRAGVERRVDLLVGALAPPALHATHRPVDPPGDWYSCAHSAAERGPFDLVFIDGPPARDGRPRRAPALPLMWDSIADGAVIVLDDARRRGERACAAQWRATFGPALRIEYVAIEKGLWVMHKRAAA